MDSRRRHLCICYKYQSRVLAPIFKMNLNKIKYKNLTSQSFCLKLKFISDAIGQNFKGCMVFNYQWFYPTILLCLLNSLAFFCIEQLIVSPIDNQTAMDCHGTCYSIAITEII